MRLAPLPGVIVPGRLSFQRTPECQGRRLWLAPLTFLGILLEQILLARPPLGAATTTTQATTATIPTTSQTSLQLRPMKGKTPTTPTTRSLSKWWCRAIRIRLPRRQPNANTPPIKPISTAKSDWPRVCRMFPRRLTSSTRLNDQRLTSIPVDRCALSLDDLLLHLRHVAST